MSNSDSYCICSRCFQIVCIIAVLFLVSWCLWDYCQDEDTTEIIFRKYGQDEDCIYPDVTICGESPYDPKKLKQYGGNISTSLYSTFLVGQDFVGYWDKEILNIDYHKISMDLGEHLIGKALVTSSKFSKMSRTINISYSNSFPGYKCNTFHLPSKMRILQVSIAVRNSLFPSGFRPKNGFDLVLHYPQQKLLSWQFITSNWNKRNNETSKSYQTDVNVKDVEVIRRRNKGKEPCVNSKSYDNDTFQIIMESVGCCPPYANQCSGLPPCSTKEELKSLREMFGEALRGSGSFAKMTPLCNTIQKIGVDYADTDFDIGKLLNGSENDPNLDIERIMQMWNVNG